MSIGETTGIVVKPKDVGEMQGGYFMRVRIEVDITKPLCRGRKISQDGQGKVSFMYERLQNICYWCGQVSHVDKDCILWLSSKGTLQLEEQQFGLWIQAPQFNPTRKSIVEVKGYEVTRKPSSASSQDSIDVVVRNHTRQVQGATKDVGVMVASDYDQSEGSAMEAELYGDQSEGSAIGTCM